MNSLVSLVSLVLLAGALGLNGCSGHEGPSPFVAGNSDAPLIPVLVSSDTAVGRARLVLKLDGHSGPPLIPKDASITVRFLDVIPDGFRFRSQTEPERVQTSDMEYLIAEVNFDHVGFWAIEVVATLSGGKRLSSGRLALEIDGDSDGLRAGDPAIPSVTPTDSDTPLRSVSIDEVLAREQPFVVVFTTPEACPNGNLCARAITQVERLSVELGLAGIHVSPLELDKGSAVLPSPSNVRDNWKLATDPWIFVVDSSGLIVGSLELIVSDAELRRELAEVVGS